MYIVYVNTNNSNGLIKLINKPITASPMDTVKRDLFRIRESFCLRSVFPLVSSHSLLEAAYLVCLLRGRLVVPECMFVREREYLPNSTSKSI